MDSHLSISTNSTCCSNSITALLGALCDTCLSGVSWKRRAVGTISQEGARRTLRKRAYAILLAKVFQQQTMNVLCRSSLADSTPPRNKILMISFDIRLSGYQDKANRLENLLEMLQHTPATNTEGLDSVLELLVQLAGSVPPPPASFSQDYMSRELSMQRHPQLAGYQSEELYNMESWLSSLMYGEERGALVALQKTVGLMDAPPGTGLLVLGRGAELEERFTRDTRMSLFGAIHHAHISDLEIRLDLPPIPSNIEVTGLAIRVPPCLDQSEDEGFQSASNLTPDSQSEPSPSPELDIWAALQNFEPGRRRCWENVGCPPGRKVEPYLTEGGREAFDHLCSVTEGHLRVVSSLAALSLPLLHSHTQTQIVGDLLNVLVGVASVTFPLNQETVQFEVRPGVCLSGVSPESVSRLLEELAQYGTHYLRLSRFSLQSAQKRGLVFQAFTGGLCRYLHYYRACVLSTPASLSLLTISFLFRKLGRQLRYLSELCCVDGSEAAGQATFPAGVKLLSYLYNEAQSNCSNENYPVLLSLLKSSCEPYTRFVSDWVYGGVFRDVYKEFMIQVNEDYLSFRDKNFWIQGYTLISQDVEECVPVFLRHIANDVYVCGKTINLLKICCPQHYICWSELPVPRIAVTFSLQEVEEIERECAVYRGRMERIAKRSALSREEQASRTEQARQELIIQVRRSTAKTMARIKGHQLSERLVTEAKKRERFEEIKEHLEKEREWRSAAKLKKQEDEFSYARELLDRERRLQALEEQLEQRVRKDVMSHYRQLSEAAARREQRALWRVQRMQLHRARARFLTQEEKLVEVLLERYPLGQGQEPKDTSLSLTSLRLSTQELQSQHDTCEGLKLNQDSMPEVPPECLLSSCTMPSIGKMPLSLAESDLNNFLLKIPQSTEDDIGSNLPKVNTSSGTHDCGSRTQQKPLNYDEACAQQGTTAQLCSAELTHDQKPPKLECQAATDFQMAQIISPQSLTVSEKLEISGTVIPLLQEFSSELVAMDPFVRGSQIPPSYANKQEHLLHASVMGAGFDKTDQSCTSSYEHTSDADTRVEQHIFSLGPNGPLQHTDTSHTDAHSPVGAPLSVVVCPLPPANIHGHGSDDRAKAGGSMSETSFSLCWNRQGHPSDCSLTVGCVVTDVGPPKQPLSRSKVPGHCSDATLGLGCVVKCAEAVKVVLPGNASGHLSDSALDSGCIVKDTEPVHPLLPRNDYGHTSDSALGFGCVVKGTEPVRAPLPGSTYGHSSDSTLGLGCVVKDSKPVHALLPRNAYGHSSDSTLGVGCVVKDTKLDQVPLTESTYDKSSDSALGFGMKDRESGQACLHGSAYSHSLDAVFDAQCNVKVSGLDNGVNNTAQKSTVKEYPGGSALCNRSNKMEEDQDQKFGHEMESTTEHKLFVDGISSWACSIHFGESTEQDYLQSLAAQYEVEQYEDNYSLLTTASDSQQLQQVVRGPHRFPGTQALGRATDDSAIQLSEMVSLPVLMKHSVTTPLITHVSLVNKAVVDYFFVELEVERHFEALRHFLLMEDGEFAQSLSDLLFEKLNNGQSPGELLTPLVLNSILSKALQYSLHGGSALAANFTFALRFLPERFHPHAPDVLNCLELCYKVDWPLNIIITDSCMDKYNRLFSFLLQLKHMVWTLRDVWFHLKRAALVKGAGNSVQFRQLQLYRHEMQHFVKVIQGYIANQILQVSWSEFIHKLGNANDLDAIHRTHADYLNRAIFRGLLTEKAAPVMNIIHSIFSLILKFRDQLITQPWSSQHGVAVHPSFVAMQQSYNTFKYYSHFLFKVVTKLVNRGYQPHLEDFLLRINFNNYYEGY